MSRLRLWAAVVLLGGLAVGRVNAVESDEFQVLLSRNPFGIRPLPVGPTSPVVQVSTNVHYVGINRLGSAPKVYLIVKDAKGAMVPFNPLREGERQDDLTVISISDKNIVKVMKGGIELTLNMKENGLNPTYTGTSPAGLGLPAQPGQPGYNPALSGAGGYVNPANQAFNPNGTVTTRTPTANLSNPSTQGNGTSSSLRQIPQRPLRMGNQNPPGLPGPAEAVSTERLDEHKRLYQRDIETGNAPPLPPTSPGEYSGPPGLP